MIKPFQTNIFHLVNILRGFSKKQDFHFEFFSLLRKTRMVKSSSKTAVRTEVSIITKYCLMGGLMQMIVEVNTASWSENRNNKFQLENLSHFIHEKYSLE